MQTTANLLELQRPRWFSGSESQSSRQSWITVEPTFVVVEVRSSFDPLRQISGSLQQLRQTQQPRGLPSSDPYRSSSEHQASPAIGILSLDFGMEFSHPPEKYTRALDALLTTTTSMPKTVASFLGRVESLIGDSATVLLINQETGERLESRCDAEVLRENGIDTGDEFRCDVVRSKGTTVTHLSRLPPKVLPKERVDQIRASFKDRWKF